MNHDITRLGLKKVKERHYFALEVLKQAPKRIRTRQRVLQSTERQAFCCAIARFPGFCTRYRNKEYSSGFKQLVPGVNRILRARY